MDTLSIKEKNVLMNEVTNDGKTAYLYYSTKYKMFVAYGISAYLVIRTVHSVKAGYDGDLQMPMVKVDDQQMTMLKEGLEEIVVIEGEFMQLEAAHNYDELDYDEWAGFLRNHYLGE